MGHAWPTHRSLRSGILHCTAMVLLPACTLPGVVCVCAPHTGLVFAPLTVCSCHVIQGRREGTRQGPCEPVCVAHTHTHKRTFRGFVLGLHPALAVLEQQPANDLPSTHDAQQSAIDTRCTTICHLRGRCARHALTDGNAGLKCPLDQLVIRDSLGLLSGSPAACAPPPEPPPSQLIDVLVRL